MLSKRLQGKHLAGYWEFPGGKVEDNEETHHALIREIKEEINLSILYSKPLISIDHTYETHAVTLHIYSIDEYEGELKCLQVEELKWVNIYELYKYKLPPANTPIIKTLLLNDYYAITQEDFTASNKELERVNNMLDSGIKLLQLRLSQKNKEAIETIINKLSKIENYKKLTVILNSHQGLVEKYQLSGLHLKSSQLFEYKEIDKTKEYLVGASCHNTTEIEHANKLGLDYIFISPVKTTKHYSTEEILGWESFSELVKLANMPVYALGGMLSDDLSMARQAGARGIAMIRGAWEY